MIRKYTLKPHSDNPHIGAIESTVEGEISPDVIRLVYKLAGDVDLFVFPEFSACRVGDKLWKDTCFELFIKLPNGSYLEFNFSPSGKWAAYSFEDYRAGMQEVKMSEQPDITCVSDNLGVSLNLILPLATPLLSSVAPEDLLIALSIVLRLKDQRYCYFALNFPLGKPDFHHPTGFIPLVIE